MIQNKLNRTKVSTMKIKAVISIISSVVLTACVTANATPDQASNSDYRIQVFKDCEKVKDIAMSPSQISAYKAFQKIENKMALLERPVRDMDEELAEYHAQLEALSSNFKYEDENVLKVDKQKLRRHKEIARKIEQIVRSHEADIRVIEREARRIESASKRFEQAIKPSLVGLEHDQVQIINRQTTKPHQCYQQS